MFLYHCCTTSFSESLTSGSAHAQILLKACCKLWQFLLLVSAGKNFRHLSLVNHFEKQIIIIIHSKNPAMLRLYHFSGVLGSMKIKLRESLYLASYMQVSTPFKLSYSSGISIHVEKLVVTCLMCLHPLPDSRAYGPMCLTCLRAFASYLPSFFTRLACLKQPHIFMQITWLQFFSVFTLFKYLQFLTCFMCLPFFYKMWKTHNQPQQAGISKNAIE